MKKKIAFLFPAFITELTGKEIDLLESNSLNINDYLNRISLALGVELPPFSYRTEYYRQELNSQLLAYSFSCAFYDILKLKKIIPGYMAGYSMGIYASLYAAGSIGFEVGAKLIFKAYNLVRGISEQRKYGMGAVIGLPFSDVEKLIVKHNFDLEIINVNNEHSLVVAGKKSDLVNFLSSAKEEGALSAGELTVNTPYHSKYLISFSQPFKQYVEQIAIYNAKTQLVSTFDQRLIAGAGDIRQELVYNLTEKINWHKTMQQLIRYGVGEMYECGAGKDLKKISRFIDGDYNLKSVYKI